MWIYKKHEQYTLLEGGDNDLVIVYRVGFFQPDGYFIGVDAFDSRFGAERLVHYLNGGNLQNHYTEIQSN